VVILMTGPEHYQLSEQLLDTAEGLGGNLTASSGTLAAAQVHATLALAAATAIAASDEMPLSASEEWETIAGRSADG
jgi:hypothetical protein